MTKAINLVVLLVFAIAYFMLPLVVDVTDTEKLHYNTVFWVCLVGFFVLNGSKGEN